MILKVLQSNNEERSVNKIGITFMEFFFIMKLLKN